ncbi:hypothetical protein [Sphingomonas bacterium]|uniref:hypothetical protein n=1 Tax=Sphingomonas bacterium TaxID=1895847 RepID=UPI00157570FA|nr:hypothetical protein [Sphingomonas bacterium]
MNTIHRRDLLIGFGVSIAGSPALALRPHGRTTVMVMASMHKRLASSKRYTYDDLYSAVARFHPDWVGVEIRNEDLGKPDEYLLDNYPVEMVELAHHFPSRTFGFDWLGDEIAGRPIPKDWWTVQSP